MTEVEHLAEIIHGIEAITTAILEDLNDLKMFVERSTAHHETGIRGADRPDAKALCNNVLGYGCKR